MNYAASITDHRKVPGSGLFQFGATTGTHVADFDASFDPINGLTYDESPSTYTVQDGDTLSSIALQIWGDANFWYLIADANGLDASASLSAGQNLIIPNQVANNQNNASTYKVYNPNDAMGNVSPTMPPKADKGCGVFGQILETIVSVVVTMVTGCPDLGNIAGQVFGLITGIQKSFNWDSLAMTYLTMGVDQGLDASGLFSGAPLSQFVEGAASSAIAQGIGVATGLQKSFNWGDVAAAGVARGTQAYLSQALSGSFDSTDAKVDKMYTSFVSGMAGDIAYAATRTLVTGTDFGDNMIKALPQVLSTLGSFAGDEIRLANEQPGPTVPGTDNLDGTPQPEAPGPAPSLGLFRNVRYVDGPTDSCGNLLSSPGVPLVDAWSDDQTEAAQLALGQRQADTSDIGNGDTYAVTGEDAGQIETVVVYHPKTVPTPVSDTLPWNNYFSTIGDAEFTPAKTEATAALDASSRFRNWWNSPSRLKTIDAISLSDDSYQMAQVIKTFPETAQPRTMSNGEVALKATSLGLAMAGPIAGAVSEAAAVATPEVELATEELTPAQQIMTNLKGMSFISAPNKALFYSGPGAGAFAEEFAGESGLMTIGDTEGGAYLSRLELYGENSPVTRGDANNLWAYASGQYAQGATGEVTAILNTPSASSIYLQVERPILINNPDVVLTETTIPDLYLPAWNYH